MSAPRAIVDPERLRDVTPGASVQLPDAAAHRFGRVLRVAAGATIELFDGDGRIVRGQFAPPAGLKDAEVLDASDVLPPLWLAQAMTKADKLEQVAQRATELGVSRLLLFDAGRSQVHLDDDRADKRRARLLRVAEDAVRQSGRSRTPAIDGPVPFTTLLEVVRGFAGLCVVGAVDAEAPLSGQLAADPARAAHGVLIVVGPEGGLDRSEVTALGGAGAMPVRLGAYVLRTETAGLAALSAVQAWLGHL